MRAEELADRFSIVLRAWLTKAELAEAVRRNATPEYGKCCATHDFCDANEAMALAMEGSGLDWMEDGGRIDTAWTMARNNKFAGGLMRRRYIRRLKMPVAPDPGSYAVKQLPMAGLVPHFTRHLRPPGRRPPR